MRMLAFLKNSKAKEAYQHIVGYGFAGVLSGMVILTQIFCGNLLGQTSLYLLFILNIALSTWYKGLKVGLFASGVGIIAVTYFSLFSYPPANNAFTLLIQLALFTLCAITLAQTIDFSWHHKKLKEYQQKIRSFELLIDKNKQEHADAMYQIKARDEFLSIASHELKTPLTSMLLQLQTILNSIKNVSLANFSVSNLLKMLESAESQSKRVAKMINDLLNISLITTGRLDLEREEVDLSKVTRDIVTSFKERIEKDGYSVKVDAPKPIKGMWDKTRLEQALANLISNSLKYGNKKPIEIAVINSNSTAKFIIKDQGIGLSSTQKEKIFERFERGVNAPGYKGLGVGLYISSQIVKAHGGKIKVESKEGHGSTFTIELPMKANN